MEKICILKGDLNKCEYLGSEQRCNAPHSQCDMCVKLDCQEQVTPKGYVRQERWFEKYNKKNITI